jgi:hypothetical protein
VNVVDPNCTTRNSSEKDHADEGDRGRAHRDQHRDRLTDRDVVPDMSVRQKEPEPDGNGRGEQLDQVGPQAPFAAQDTGELAAPAFRAGRRRHLPRIGVRRAYAPTRPGRRRPGGAAAGSFPTLAGASDPERHPQRMRKTRKTRCRGGGPPVRAIIRLG